jgi:aspartate/methionine/tyrosine aminotransferase
MEDSIPTNVISAKVAAIAPSATLAVDAKAKALKAAGENVIGFGAGEPDFPTPEHIVQAAIKACSNPRNHHYTPTSGLLELKEAVVAKTARDSGLQIKPANVLVSAGAKHAVYSACMTLLDPGDEVILPGPYWGTYAEIISLAGGIPKIVHTDESSSFKATVEQLEKALSPHTKMLIFVSPSNPTGTVYDQKEMTEIGKWVAETGIWILTDEIYEHLVYETTSLAPCLSMPVCAPETTDRCVVINGVSKTYAMTGWRVGWLIGPENVIKAADNLQSNSTSNIANVSQMAAVAALEGDMSSVESMRDTYNRRRKLIISLLKDIPGITCMEPKGAFYVFPSLKALLGHTYNGVTPTTTLELAETILDQAKVAFVPGEAFDAPGYARFSYAVSDSDIEEGIGRMKRLVEESI